MFSCMVRGGVRGEEVEGGEGGGGGGGGGYFIRCIPAMEPPQTSQTEAGM